MHYDVLPWLTGTTGRAKLTQQALNALPVAIPPNVELEEIVRRVESLIAFADRLEDRLAQAQTAVDRLTPSLLAKAFRGELVPQDPADEPAAECSSAWPPSARSRLPGRATSALRSKGAAAAASHGHGHGELVTRLPTTNTKGDRR
jgi:hypothetical protein